MHFLQWRTYEQIAKRAFCQARKIAAGSWLALTTCAPPPPASALQAEQRVREAAAELCECDCGTVMFIPTFETEYAHAIVMTNVTVIEYNPSFVENLCETCKVGLLGHEYGHHLSHPSLWATTKEAELEADRISGCMLRLRGMDPTDWMSVMLTFGWEETETHPNGPTRANAIREGWEACGVVE